MLAITDLTFVSAISINVSHDRTPKQKDVTQKKKEKETETTICCTLHAHKVLVGRCKTTFPLFFYHYFAARNCGHPGTPVNGNISSYVFTFGSTVEYTCDKGFTLVGSKQRVCQANQTWSGILPQCTSRFGSFIII